MVVKLEDYTPPAFSIAKVELTVRLIPHAASVVAKLHLAPSSGPLPRAPLVLNGDGLTLKSVLLNDKPLDVMAYAATPDSFTLYHPPQHPFTLTFKTEIDADANSQCMGLYRSNGIWCTQCEAEGFRRITYFLDRPDVMSVYTTRIEALQSEAPVLLGNGNPIETGALAEGWHYALWHDPHPKPAYLFALVGGKLASLHDEFTTKAGQKVALGIYVEEGKQDRCAYAMDALKRSMVWDEQVFGCIYDLDVFNIVAVSDFNMGAMENKGLNIFNDKYVLALPETATDIDYDNIERIIAHEYFHNWTGNRITCRDWFQLCLKEGLTVYRDQEFSSDTRSRTVKRIEDVRTLRARQFPEDAGPLAHPVRPTAYAQIDNFYTATVYEKGAEVIRMLRLFIGDAAFWAGMQLYFKRHDGEAATIEQFIACFAQSSGQDLTQFSLWYAQAGTPRLKVESHYDEIAKTLNLTLTQSLPDTPNQTLKKPMVIPLALGLIDDDGKDYPLILADGTKVDKRVVITEQQQSFVFKGIDKQPVLSLNRGFSAPVHVDMPQSEADLAFLARHDGDAFNRWEALQRLATDWLMRESRAQHHASAGLICDAFAVLIAKAHQDPAFSALAMTLPTELDVARALGRDVDPIMVQGAVKTLKMIIAQALRPALLALAQSLPSLKPFSPDAQSAGRRALKAAALHLAASDGHGETLDTLLAQSLTADNMSERYSAMQTLAQHATPHRERAFAAYYDLYKDDAIALDKWFALQASIGDDAAVQRVEALMQHPQFTLRNPNRARSVLGTFALSNPVGFGAANGAGFMLVAQQMIELDKLNSQTAARILNGFGPWKAYEPKRRVLAEQALRFLARHDLSINCRDIVERCLN